MRLRFGEKEPAILGTLHDKGAPMTAREIAEAIYGKGKHQSIVFSTLEIMVKSGKLSKYGAKQPFAYGLANAVSACFRRDVISAVNEASRDFVIDKRQSEDNAVDRMQDTPHYSTDSLIQAATAYYDLTRTDEHARYLSWEHCYRFFLENHDYPSAATIDTACLHLAWYLASWGMLRNSFLMQKDYRVHQDAVMLLFSERYAVLYNLTPDMLCDEAYLAQIMQLVKDLDRVYMRHAAGYSDHITDTLLSKVLLGTVGCAPAYDRYFKTGLRLTGIAPQQLSSQSLQKMAQYYKKNETIFQDFQKEIGQRVQYPPMKIMDMCLWQIGYDAKPE